MLSSDIRTAFVQALLDPDKYQSHFAEVNMKEALYAQYSAAVTFTNDDLMLKTTEHNRPNYVIGEIDNHKVNRILLDPGSSVSLLPLRPLKGNQPKQKLRPRCSPKWQKDLSQPRNYRAGRNHQQFPLQRMTKVQKKKLFSMQQARQNQKRFFFLDDTSSDAGSSVLHVGSESDSEREVPFLPICFTHEVCLLPYVIGF